MTLVHRSRAGVRGLAAKGDLVALDAEGAEDDAERQVERLEHRPLLDVQLEVRRRVLQPAARLERAVEVDSVLGEGVRQRDPVRVAALTQLVLVAHRAGRRRGAEQRATEARTLLVGPVDDPHGQRRRPVVGDPPQDLHGRDDVEAAVEPAAVRHGVDVAAEQQRALGGARQREPLVPGLVDLLLGPRRDDLLAQPLPRALPRLGPRDALRAVLVAGQLPAARGARRPSVRVTGPRHELKLARDVDPDPGRARRHRRRRLRRGRLRRRRARRADRRRPRRRRRPHHRRGRQVRPAGLHRPAHASRHAVRRHGHDRRLRVRPGLGGLWRDHVPRRLLHPGQGPDLRRGARGLARQGQRQDPDRLRLPHRRHRPRRGRHAGGARHAAGAGRHLLQALHGVQGRPAGRRRDALPRDAGRRGERRARDGRTRRTGTRSTSSSTRRCRVATPSRSTTRSRGRPSWRAKRRTAPSSSRGSPAARSTSST